MRMVIGYLQAFLMPVPRGAEGARPPRRKHCWRPER